MAKEQNYEQFYDEEIIFRQMLGYPPIQNILKISISSKNEEALLLACQDMTKWQDNIKNEFFIKSDLFTEDKFLTTDEPLSKNERTVSSMENNLGIRINEKEDIQVTGPIKAPIYKLNDIYTQIVLVKSKDYEILTDFKDKCDMYIKDNVLYKNISVQYDFN